MLHVLYDTWPKTFFGFFELLVLDKRSRDHRTHGIVGNMMANSMRALPSPYGASLGSEGPPKGQKYAFGTKNYLFREIRGIMKIRFPKFLVTNLQKVCPGIPAPI